MLHKCANPTCSKRFLRLSQGKLFRIEIDDWHASSPNQALTGRRPKLSRRVEHYWLCEECSHLLTLTFEKGIGVITVPLLGIKRKSMPDLHVAETNSRLEAVPVAGIPGEQ